LIRIVLLLVVLLPSLADATTYYVGKSGSDANSCATAQSSTAANRKLTIAAGLACAVAGNGDTVIVGDGTYTEGLTQANFVRGTSWSNALTLRSENAYGAIIKPGSSYQAAFDLDTSATPLQYVIIGVSGGGFDIDGSTLPNAGPPVFPRGLIKIWGTCAQGWVNHIRFQYNKMHGYVSSGNSGSTFVTAGDACASNPQYLEVLSNELYSNGYDGFSNSMYIQTGYNLFKGNTIHDSKGAGIALSQQNSGRPDNNIVEGNLCYNMGLTNTKGDCILLAGANAANNLIRNNIGATSTDWSCINAEESGPVNNKFYNNTCYGNPLYGINVGGSGNIVKNNIAYSNTTANIRDVGTGNTVSNNTTANPSFTNAATRDFTLQSGSVARDAGTNLAPDVTDDYAGVARPQNGTYDTGAYEYVVSGGSSGGMLETPSWSSPRRSPLWRR